MNIDGIVLPNMPYPEYSGCRSMETTFCSAADIDWRSGRGSGRKEVLSFNLPKGEGGQMFPAE